MQVTSNEFVNARPSNASLLILLTATFVPLVICLFAAFKHSGMWTPTILLLLVACGVIAWVKSFSVRIESGILRYRSLFGGIKQVSVKDIREARVEVGSLKYSDRFRPPVRLVIICNENSEVPSFDINLRPFERSGIRQLISALPMAER